MKLTIFGHTFPLLVEVVLELSSLEELVRVEDEDEDPVVSVVSSVDVVVSVVCVSHESEEHEFGMVPVRASGASQERLFAMMIETRSPFVRALMFIRIALCVGWRAYFTHIEFLGQCVFMCSLYRKLELSPTLQQTLGSSFLMTSTSFCCFL